MLIPTPPVPCLSQGPLRLVIWSARKKPQFLPISVKNIVDSIASCIFPDFGKDVAFNFRRYIYKVFQINTGNR